MKATGSYEALVFDPRIRYTGYEDDSKMETHYSVYVVEVSVKNGENYVSAVFLDYWEAEDYINCVDKITGETHYIVVHELEREHK